MIGRLICIAVVVLTGLNAADAAITDLHWQSFDGEPSVAGSVQNTLFASATADWTNAVLTVQLTAGQLLNPVATGATSEWRMLGGDNDTWLALPSAANGGTPTINLFGQDSPLVPGVDHTFDWFDTANTGAFTDGIAARIYATDTANGTFSVQMFDRDSAGEPTGLDGIISNGFFSVAVTTRAGDFNDDGKVDAADYTVWRDNFGASAGTLKNDVDGGVIGPAHYATWKSHFGTNYSGSGSMSSVPVPESASIVFVLAAAGCMYCFRCPRRIGMIFPKRKCDEPNG
jgi:hypothetical protein